MISDKVWALVIQVTCGRNNWTLQQNRARSHTAKNTINFLRSENVSFIEPDMWSPNSPDLNLVDYAIWGALHYITLHYQHFKLHLHLKWLVLHQQLHVIRNTAHRPNTQASYTASRVRPKGKISCAAAQIAATLTISFPRWRHMSLTSYWGQQNEWV